MEVKMFKAQKDTKRFKKNQKVWIAWELANHLYIFHKWRGSGRYVSSIMAKWDHKWDDVNPIIGVGGIKTIDVDSEFANRIEESIKQSR